MIESSKRRWYWYCKICNTLLDMHLDHVDTGPRPKDGCSSQCTGTFAHPFNGCSLRGRILRHSQTCFEVKP